MDLLPAPARRPPRWLGWGLAFLLAATPAFAQQYRFEGVERVVAIGDVHGAYPEFVSVLKGTGLVDGQLRWTGGKAHLVSTGDLFSRGDDALQVIELLRRLQEEAAATGGAVHVLLGNHEVMSLTGDLRYVSPGEFAKFTGKNAAATPDAGQVPGYAQRMQALAPDGELGRWLLARPVMIVVNDDAFVHGGLSDMLKGRSLEDINRDASRDVRAFAESWHELIQGGALQPGDNFDRILATAKQLAAAPPPGSPSEPGEPAPLTAPAARIVAAVAGLPFEPNGPLWYRGNSLCHPYTETPVATSVLAGLRAERVVVGHTPTLDRHISSRLDGHVIRIDSGMNKAVYQGNASALVIEDGRTSAFHAGEGIGPVRAEANREWARPYGLSDAQIEEFLLTAPITSDEELDLGVTKPRRLTLERGGQRMRAVFKTLDTDPGVETGRWERRYEPADRYGYEVAAYKLDRLIGLQMVPVAVLRTVGKERGLVQFWVEDATNETDRIAKNIRYDSDCSFARQHALINMFDVLIRNVDRNTGNILYDRDWQAWVIDHGRAFGTDRSRPEALRGKVIPISPLLAEALQQVTEANLQPLQPYLHPLQIRALVRRAKMLQQAR